MGKKTLVRIEEGATATSVAYGCAALLDAGLAETVGVGSDAEEGLDCGGALAVRVARRLELLRHRLEAAGEHLARISDELGRQRRRRDRATAALYAKTKGLREMCRGIFEGNQGDEFLGLRGTLPREPKELHALCGPVVRRVADPSWPIPEKQLSKIELDREGITRAMVKAYRELGEVLAQVKDGETREGLAKVARRRAARAHNAFLDKSARYLEAALELAGLDDVAATVRPGVGRRGRPRHELDGPPGEQVALPETAAEPVEARLLTESVEGGEAVPEVGPESAD